MMRMDMELIKKILLYVEEHGEPGKLMRQVEIDGYSVTEVSYHIKLLSQNGLLEGRDARIDQYFLWYAGDITWAGHEFLSSIRNDTVWKKLKDKFKEEGGAIPFSILKALAIKYTEQQYL